MGSKKEFLDIFIKGAINTIILDSEVRKKNTELITNLIMSFTKEEMDKFVSDLESGKQVIPIIVPDGYNAISYENNINIIEKRKIKLFKRIKVTDGDKTVMSPIPFMVAEVTGRKPIQLLDKKRSIPMDDKSRSTLTGQVTNKSKSMSLTSPEVSLMLSNGMYDSIVELTRYRGGDEAANLIIKTLASHGVAITQEKIKQYANGPEVNSTLKQFLLAMHIDSNINEMNR